MYLQYVWQLLIKGQVDVPVHIKHERNMMDYKYWLKRSLIILGILIAVFLSYKFIIFYIPFLIAYIISVIIEPLIMKITEKSKWSRKTSSIVVLLIVFGILIRVSVLGGF